MARAVCDVIRTTIIWLAGIIITVTVGHDDDIYKWESTNPKAIALDVVGFAILIVGNLIYY